MLQLCIVWTYGSHWSLLLIIAEHLSATQPIFYLRRPQSQPMFVQCTYTYTYNICVAIVSHAQVCNYHWRLMHMRWYYHACVRFSVEGVHLGTRLRLLMSIWRGQWSCAVSTLHNWVQTLAKIATYVERALYFAYISNSSNLLLAIFLQQLMTTNAYFMRPHLLIKLLCMRHTQCRCIIVLVWCEYCTQNTSNTQPAVDTLVRGLCKPAPSEYVNIDTLDTQNVFRLSALISSRHTCKYSWSWNMMKHQCAPVVQSVPSTVLRHSVHMYLWSSSNGHAFTVIVVGGGACLE